MSSPALRVCRSCGVGKPLTSFRRSAAARDGRAATCRACVTARERTPRTLQARLRAAIDAGDDDEALRLAPAFLEERSGHPRFGHEGWLLYQAALKGRPKLVARFRDAAPADARRAGLAETRDVRVRDLLLVEQEAKASGAELTETVVRESRKGHALDPARWPGYQPDARALCAIGAEEALVARLDAHPAELHARGRDGETLLHVCAASALGRAAPAVASRLRAIAAWLLDAGCAPDDAGHRQAKTPLFLAAEHGNLAVAELLLDRGADPNHAKNDDTIGGATPLDAALQHEWYDVAERLVARGADPNLLVPYAYKGKTAQVRWLLAHGADPNRPDAHGGLPLHLAARRNTHTLVARALVEAGADLDRRDAAGLTAEEVARREEKREVHRYLREARRG